MKTDIQIMIGNDILSVAFGRKIQNCRPEIFLAFLIWTNRIRIDGDVSLCEVRAKYIAFFRSQRYLSDANLNPTNAIPRRLWNFSERFLMWRVFNFKVSRVWLGSKYVSIGWIDFVRPFPYSRHIWTSRTTSTSSPKEGKFRKAFAYWFHIQCNCLSTWVHLFR